MSDLINRQQAIDALERAKQNIHHNIERAIGDAVCGILDEVENGIKQLPSTNCSEFPNNSDTISRQAAIDAIQAHKHNVLDAREYDEGVACGYAAAHNHICDVIAILPSAQPEIVRCKECKHYEHGICKKAGLCVNKSPNGFCDWAERRKDG